MDERISQHCNQHGVILRRDILELGYDDKFIRAAMRGNLLTRVRHGVYTLSETWADATADEQHLLAALGCARRAQAPVALSHLSAAIALGADLWDVPLDEVHVTRLDGRAGRSEAGVRQHKRLVAPEDLVHVGEQLATAATRTALDLTTILDVEHALVPIDWLLHHGLVDLATLQARSSEVAQIPGSLHTRIIVALADGRSESVGETRTRYAIWRAGLPKPVPQYEVYDGALLLGRLDLAWPELRLWLEFDGKGKYAGAYRSDETATDVVLREKAREDRIRELTGWRCIRVTWADLYRPEQLVARLRRAMLAAA